MHSTPKALQWSGEDPAGELPSAVRLTAPSRSAATHLDMDLLRFTTVGSVDDGKSTLVGRLLYDTKSILEDQLQEIERVSRRRGDDGLNLALITDGLRAEREQDITIDVAYRYFATPRRKFIIADTPGHVQYTRNMVTGASTAELAIILVDARHGVVTQSKRHGFIAALMRIPHVIVAVNKMDLVGYREEVFQQISSDYRGFAQKLEISDLLFVPISALRGDNVVVRSGAMAWYSGPTLLQHLEAVSVGADRNLIDFRYPVQYVVRHEHDYRGLAGRIASGTITPGEDLVLLPSGVQTRVRTISAADQPVEEAIAGDSVVITIQDQVDVARGDMLVRRTNVPQIDTRLDAVVCWLDMAPLDRAKTYELQQTTRRVRARVIRLIHRIDVDTLLCGTAGTLGLNDVGRVELTTAQPVFFDPYSLNRTTGSFILVDPFTHATVAAGMIRGPLPPGHDLFAGAALDPAPTTDDIQGREIGRDDRERRNGHKAAVLWFTGLSGSGKSTIARALEHRLFHCGCSTVLLDGDSLRQGLSDDLAFSAADRSENIRRAGEVARLFFDNGQIVLCSFISPYARDRARVRGLFNPSRFLEIFVDCPLGECARRDPKGLYALASTGELTRMTGVSDPYEVPLAPELVARSAEKSTEEIVTTVVARLRDIGILPRDGDATV